MGKESVRNRLKQIRIETDPTITPSTPLESHHCYEQAHNGGRMTLENGFAETHPEHAFSHYVEGCITEDPDEKRANFWAVGAILKRSTHQDVVEYLHMVQVRRKRSTTYESKP